MQLIKNKYHELSLAKKFSFLSILIMVVSILSFTIVIRIFFERSILNITSDGYKEKFDIASESSQKIFADAEKIAKVLLTDDAVQNWFLEDSRDIAKRLHQKIQVEKRLDYFDALYPDNQYSSISVFDSQGNMVNTNSIRSQMSVYQQFFSVIENNAETKRWLDLYELEIPDYNEKGIACIRYYRDYTSGKIKGYIMIEYRSPLLVSNFIHMKYGDTGSYLVADLNGNSKIRDNEDSSQYIGKEEFYLWACKDHKEGKVFRINGERCLITSDIIPKLDWVMIGIVPVGELMQQGDTIVRILYVLGALVILMGTWFSIRIAHSVTGSLTRLANTMERFGRGELTASVPIEYKDEVGMLSEEFNKMAQQIQQLVEQVYREQREKRKSELAALQAQINPHFLYNTLNSVSALIRMECSEEAFTMIHAISMFYRTSLSDGKTLVPIEQEIVNIENYIQIQKIRYEGKIEYEIDIASEIRKEWIVKLTLQPLIENSIYHGIKKMKRKGKVTVRGWKNETQVILQVTDNGVGIPKEKKDRIMSGGYDGKRYSYGLVNVQQRLQLYFGRNYGLTIESTPDEGTIATIRVPAGFRGEDQKDESFYRG